MSYFLCDVDVATKIATVTFNRPEKLNAIRREDVTVMQEKIDDLEYDDNVKVIVFKGAGSCFGAGMDVADMQRNPGHKGQGSFDASQPKAGVGYPPPQRHRLLHEKYQNMGRFGVYTRVLFCQKATICQVHGYCYGWHYFLAVNSDIVIASDDALFTHPGFRYAGPMGNMPLYFLTMGLKRTKELLLTGRALTAEEAVAIGFANKVVPAGQLDEEVKRTAELIAAQPADAIVMGKACFEMGLELMGGGQLGALSLSHSLQNNIRFDPGDFHLLKARRDKGVKGATLDRDQRFKGSSLRRPAKRSGTGGA